MKNKLNSFLLVVPGLLLCCAVTLAAYTLEAVEDRVFGRAWLESLVLAILLGTAVRTLHRLHNLLAQTLARLLQILSLLRLANGTERLRQEPS